MQIYKVFMRSDFWDYRDWSFKHYLFTFQAIKERIWSKVRTHPNSTIHFRTAIPYELNSGITVAALQINPSLRMRGTDCYYNEWSFIRELILGVVNSVPAGLTTPVTRRCIKGSGVGVERSKETPSSNQNSSLV